MTIMTNKMSVGGAVATLDYLISVEGRLAVASYIDRSNQTVLAVGAGLRNQKPYYDGKAITQPTDCNTYVTVMQNGKEKFVHGLTISKELGDSILLYTRDMEEEVFYSYLMMKFDLPLLKEWTSPLIAYFKSKGCANENYRVFGRNDAEIVIGDKRVMVSEVLGSSVRMNEKVLEEAVSKLIQDGVITVTDTPQDPINVDGMNEYFSKYSSSLVSNLKNQLTPVSEHTQEMPYMSLNNMRLYPQQISQDVGCIKALLEKKTRYIILNMGMGTGKTIQAASICEGLANAKAMKQGKSLKEVYTDRNVRYRNIIMCPSHLVSKWCDEISREIPYATAVPINDFSQLVKLREEGRERKAKEFYVISKDFAKLSYQSRPCVSKYGCRQPKGYVCTKCNKSRPSLQAGDKCECGGEYVLKALSRTKAYGMTCPECGELLYAANRVIGENSFSKYADKEILPLQPDDFTAMNASNASCHLCGARLWTPCVANLDMGGPYSSWVGRSTRWKKVTHYANKAHKSTKSVWVHKSFEKEYFSTIGEKPLSEKEDVHGARKYAPATYIKKYLKGYFDVAIFDEMHKYKGGGTAQGNAMHSLIKASRYQLGLTGTIAGGYANHFFYTLFRLDPARMIKNGFRWTDEMAFCEKYGTIIRQYEYAEVTNGNYNSSSRGRQLSSPEVAPGISPLIFTDYLLDRAVFLDLSDMSRFLPALRENVVTIPTEKELVSSYNQVVKQLKELGRQKGGFGLLSKMLQFSLSYSDKPYGQQEIRNPSDGSVVCIPQSYEEYRNVDTLLNKEKKLVEIVRKELSEGRNCMIYAEYTSSPETCISYRLRDVLMKHLGLYENEAVVLESTSPAAVKREAWIHQKAVAGAKVFITNPRCVETGLDMCFTCEGKLYNYPTLIFYQMGYNMFTIWQASRRAYRLNQREECRNYYLASEGTIQPEVIKLIAEKQVATAAIQGHFSAEGLAAMAQGVDARLKLIQAIASNDTESQNELQGMFDVIAAASDDNTDYSNYTPMLTFRELMGEAAADEPPEIDVMDTQNIFDLLFNDRFMAAVMTENTAECVNDNSEVAKVVKVKKRTRKERITNNISLFDLM